MTEFANLLDDVLHKAPARFAPDWPAEGVEAHDCDGCGKATPDVDLYAENSETGEEVWLCRACGEW